MERKPNDGEKIVEDLYGPAGPEFQSLREPTRGPLPVRGAPQIPTIGRADLDPFAGGVGGGMLFDPHDPRHFPDPLRSNQPPSFIPSPSGMVPRPPLGARFDPFGPGGMPGRDFARGPRSEPNPDLRFGAPDHDHMRSFGYDGRPM